MVLETHFPQNHTMHHAKSYQADEVSHSEDEEKFYFGLADTTFKVRYNNHNRDFKQEKYENSTELAKYIWQQKSDKISFSVK